MKKLLLPAALFLSTAPALAGQAAPAAAPEADADPALWVVKDEDTTIYLFGTFHLLDGKRDWFNEEIETAFDASDELVLEAITPEDPATLQPLVMGYAIDPENRTLSSHLDEEQQRKLGEALTSMGIPAKAFDRFEPWFASMTLTALTAIKRLGLSVENGAEAVLTKTARERGIEIGELEGMEYQLRLFDGMSERAQVGWLNVALENFDDAEDDLPPMLAAWADGEVDTLAALLNENLAQYPEFYRLLLSERNANWAGWIDERLDRPGTVFVAVGAGHLGGRDSVQSLLADRGLLTTRLD